VKQSRKVVTTDAKVGLVRRTSVTGNRTSVKGNRKAC
jgi:hypothetical protein